MIAVLHVSPSFPSPQEEVEVQQRLQPKDLVVFQNSVRYVHLVGEIFEMQYARIGFNIVKKEVNRLHICIQITYERPPLKRQVSSFDEKKDPYF